VSVVDSLELWFVNFPLPAPFSPAWMPHVVRRSSSFYLVRLRSDEGVDGFSAFNAVGRERAGSGDALAQLLLGKSVHDIDHVQQMLRIPAIGGIRNFWVEPAFWDIQGKLAGRPVCELLGGARCRLRLYASCGEDKDAAARIEEAHACREAGFEMMKLRVHGDEAADLRQVQQTTKALEGKMRLAVDCNQAFHNFAAGPGPVWDLGRAKRFADACHEAGIAWVEEPLHNERHADQAALAAYARVPIAGGEVHTAGYYELAGMVDRRCYDIFQPDALWTGGISQTMALARKVREAGLMFTSHSWSMSLGLAVNLQIMAASGFADEIEFEYPYSPPGWTEDVNAALFKEPIARDGGWLEVPDRPGLGFEIDERALSHYGRCFFRASRKASVWMPEALRDLSIPAPLES
jgi:D-galactarolactone cycloisomerase